MEHLACLVGIEAICHSEQSMDVAEPGQQSISDEGQHEAFLKPNPVNNKVNWLSNFKIYNMLQDDMDLNCF